MLDERPVAELVDRLRSSASVFITIGPYHATGSSSGLPETSRKRMPSSPACTVTSSPRSNTISDRSPRVVVDGVVVRARAGVVGEHRHADAEASRNVPEPANTYANAWRVTSTGSVLRAFGGTEMSRYDGSAAIPSTGPRLPQNSPHTTRTCVPSSSVIDGMSRRRHVLVARRRHLQRRRQVGPQLEAVHAALRIALRHLLVDDAAAGRHPLHVARAERAALPRLSPCATVPAST